MLKVIHIIPSLRKGGAERLVLDIVSELQQRNNVDVKLITFSHINEYAEEYSVISPIVIPSSVKASVFGKWQYNTNALRDFIRKFQPDIIHTHLFEAEFVSRTINYSNTKWFSHSHDNMAQFKKFSIGTVLSKKALTNYYEYWYLRKNYKINGGTHFIYVSKNTQMYFRQNYNKANGVLLYNAINYKRFSIKKKLTNDNVLRMIMIGSLIPKKNQIFLIAVAEVLMKRNQEFNIELLGEGIERETIQSLISQKKFEKRITLQGNVSNVELFLSNANMYVHSAYYEPFGLVLLEAMAAGLPVVCLDGKGNRDLIQNGKNGYMVMQNDPQLFADKILEIWNNQNKYEAMSKYAQEYAKQFDIVPYVDKLLELYVNA